MSGTTDYVDEAELALDALMIGFKTDPVRKERAARVQRSINRVAREVTDVRAENAKLRAYAAWLERVFRPETVQQVREDHGVAALMDADREDGR